MYQKIMVPLDGSKLAECVLPHVDSIVTGCGTADVIFLRVVEPSRMPAGMEPDGGIVFSAEQAARLRMELDTENMALAEEYVNGVAARHRYPGAEVSGQVMMGKPAETIAEYAAKKTIDLIVIATHGYSGISRWVWGSVADKVLRASCTPILMIRAPGCVPGF